LARFPIVVSVAIFAVACSGAPTVTPQIIFVTPEPATSTASATSRPTTPPTPVSTATRAPAATRPPRPTPTPTLAPVPPGGAGRLGVPVTIGQYQRVTIADAEYSRSGYNEYIKPDPGNLIYAVLAEFEGIDPSGSSYNPFYFKLVVDGFEYSYTPFGKDPQLQSGDLRPGQTVRGWVSFEAPDADRITVVYQPIFGLAGDPAEWTFNITP
jgi:hypothetical protein